MEFIRIFIEGIVATTVMTTFSYVLANITKKEFREPELLNDLLSRSNLYRLKLSKKSAAGWILHYLIGWMFVILIEAAWLTELVEASVLSGALLGFLGGVIGIFGWKILFWINNNPPKISWSDYYIQLVIAHVLFGISTGIIYLLW